MLWDTGVVGILLILLGDDGPIVADVLGEDFGEVFGILDGAGRRGEALNFSDVCFAIFRGIGEAVGDMSLSTTKGIGRAVGVSSSKVT